jgi:hypothetical protein
MVLNQFEYFTAEAQSTQRFAEKLKGQLVTFNLLFLCVLCASAVNEPAFKAGSFNAVINNGKR